MAQLSKELHGPVRKKFPRRKVFVDGVDDTWGMDLVDMSEWKSSNDGFAWMLNIVDVFSRFAWSVPLQNKTATAVLSGFKTVLEESGRKPAKIWVDEGGEFYNKPMTTFITKENIIRYSTFGEHKSVFVERFNRTLKSRMWRKFTEENTRRWVDMLPKLMGDYNTSKHSSLKGTYTTPDGVYSSIKMTPAQASEPKNEKILLRRQKSDVLEQTTAPKKPPKFKLGDWVRISREKNVFEKGFLINWSREIFQVVSILDSNPRVYELKDTSGEKIKGSFYEQNMQKTLESPAGEFLVEEVLKKRTYKGKKQLFVKWLGYNAKFNSWIDESDVTRDY